MAPVRSDAVAFTTTDHSAIGNEVPVPLPELAGVKLYQEQWKRLLALAAA